ncbi:hypothetical protein ACFPRL_14545 [Pseudoclavibacter helvolus]
MSRTQRPCGSCCAPTSRWRLRALPSRRRHRQTRTQRSTSTRPRVGRSTQPRASRSTPQPESPSTPRPGSRSRLCRRRPCLSPRSPASAPTRSLARTRVLRCSRRKALAPHASWS